MNAQGFNYLILAVSDGEAIKKMKEYDQHLEEANPVLDIFRWGCFTIMKWLVDFVDWMSNITHDALTLFGLVNSTEIIKMIKDLEPVIMALFAGTLLYLGIKMMLGSRIKAHDKFVTLIVAIIFLTSLSSTTDRGIDITEKATEDIDNYTSDSSKTKIGTDILKNSVLDLKYMDKEMKWKKPSNNNKDGAYNKLTNQSVNYIDINEKIGHGKADTDLGKKITKNKISYDENGKEKLSKLDDGFWGIGATEYYRYSLFFWKGSLGLICTALGYFFAGLAIASIILETIVGLFVAVFGASTLQGDKLKSTIVDILNGLVAIVFVFICMFIFKQLVGFVMNKNMGIYTVGMIAGVKFMIDGPKTVERKFGYDAGLSSPIRSAMAMYSATKLATKGASAGASAVGSGVNKFKEASKSDVNTVRNMLANNNSQNSNQTSSNTQSQLNNTNTNDVNEKNDNQSNNQNTQTNTDDKNLGEQSQQIADNQGYVENTHTNDLESEKSFAENNGKASGGAQHDQLWANKPQGNILSRSDSQNNTQSFNNGKEASINNKVGNDVVNQGANSNYSNNQLSSHGSNNTSLNTNNTANNTSAPSSNGYNTPKTSAPSTNGYSAPETSTPSTNGYSAQGTSAPSTNGYSAPETSTPSTNGYSAQGTSAPSTNGYSAPKTSTPSTNGYNAPKAPNNTSVNSQNRPQPSTPSHTNRYSNSINNVNGFNQRPTHQASSNAMNRTGNIPKSHQPLRQNIGYSPKTQPVKEAKEVKTHNISKSRPQNFQRPTHNSNQTKNRIKPRR
ncbi:TPA: hypothetical protein PBT85_002525 [Staphylococcus aureus]|nr:hypothetical protein [Staphylococcus aureus]